MTSSSATYLSYPSIKAKSFRERRQLPPYRKPLVRRTNERKVSWLTRVKNFFVKRAENIISSRSDSINGNTDKQTRDGEYHTEYNRQSSPKVNHSIPGAFFNPDESTVKFVVDDSVNGDTRGATNNRDMDDGVTTGVELRDETGLLVKDSGSSHAVTTTPGSANSKLAEFFNQKGNTPLSEIEMEGVISLLKKSQAQSHRLSTHPRPRSESTLAAGAATSGNGLDAPLSSALLRDTSTVPNSLKVPSFNPTFDAPSTSSFLSPQDESITSGSGANGTITKRRRVFDYSELPIPSPYRTVIFRYKSTPQQKQQKPHTDNDSKSMRVGKPEEKKGKKLMSNTAAALVSLLDGPSVATEKTPNRDSTTLTYAESTALANPYSSLQLPHIRKPNVNLVREGETQLQHEAADGKGTELATTNKLGGKDAVLGSASGMATNTVNSTDSLSFFKKTTSTSTATATNNNNNNNTLANLSSGTTSLNSNGATTVESAVFNQYKPRRSSSLRSTVVTAVENKGKDNDDNHVAKDELAKEEKMRNEALLEVPKANKFAFSFKLPTKTQTQPVLGSQQQEEKKSEAKQGTLFKMKYAGDTVGKTNKYEYNYAFETPTASGVDPNGIDNAKVETYKSMFVF